MKTLTLLTTLLFTLVTVSCSFSNLCKDTTDFSFTITREAFTRSGVDPNAKYKLTFL